MPSDSNDAALPSSLKSLAYYIAPNIKRAIPIVKATGIQGRLENLARDYSISQRPSTRNSSTCTLKLAQRKNGSLRSQNGEHSAAEYSMLTLFGSSACIATKHVSRVCKQFRTMCCAAVTPFATVAFVRWVMSLNHMNPLGKLTIVCSAGNGGEVTPKLYGSNPTVQVCASSHLTAAASAESLSLFF